MLEGSKFDLSKLEGRLPQAMPKSTKKKTAKPADFTVKDCIAIAQLFSTNRVPESKAQARKGEKASPECCGYLV